MAQIKKLRSEGSDLFPNTLVLIGTVVILMALMESYFQMTNSSFSFLTIAHQSGYFLEYKRAVEPNKGIWHPLAWIGSAFFILMMLYSVRKHVGFLQDFGSLRYWLDAHIFLGLVATAFTTVHTTYKVGGLVSISFWSMVLVAGSGVIGRYIYIQIPRNISGNELRIDEIESIMSEINERIEEYAGNDSKITHYFELISGPKNTDGMGSFAAGAAMFFNDLGNRWRMLYIWNDLRKNQDIPSNIKKTLFKLIKEKGALIRSSNFLESSHKLLHYWHVFHKPFAFIMFIIMFLHIGVYMLFKAHG